MHGGYPSPIPERDTHENRSPPPRPNAVTGGSFRAPVRRYAIGLGCEIAHAGALVYTDDLDVRNEAAYQPIGISCRICERRTCHQRAQPIYVISGQGI